METRTGIKSLMQVGALLALCANASAQLTEYTDRNAFLAATSNITEITFAEFPVGTLLTNEYASQDLDFPDGDDRIITDVAFIDTFGLSGAGDIRINFSVPRSTIGCDYPGALKFEFFSGITPVATSQNFGGAGVGFFAGVVSAQPFDRVVISDWTDGLVFIGSILSAGGPAIVGYCFGDDPQLTCPCGNVGGSGEGCANSTGSGAILLPGGSTQVGLDNLTFTGTQLIPGQSALLFVGESALMSGTGALFGDGKLCVGGPVRRLSVAVPDAQGTAIWGPGMNAAGGWAAGDIRYFQIWYRDSTGSPCTTFFNTSQGVEVTFVP